MALIKCDECGSISIIARDPTPDEARISALLRESTAHKQAKNHDAAIACLREAYRLMETVSAVWPYRDRFRLPRCLHLAGRYDEAVAELQRLHDGRSDYEARRARAGFSPLAKSVQANIRRLIKNEIAITAEREARERKRADRKIANLSP